MTDKQRAARFHSALVAIKARIDGEYDKRELTRFGPLSVDRMVDVDRIVEWALRGEAPR